MYRIIRKIGEGTEYFHRMKRKFTKDDKGCYIAPLEDCQHIVELYQLKNAKIVKI